MAAARPAKLYSPELLGLATELALFPFNPDFPLRSEARARTCGSVITLGLALDENAHIAGIGMQVNACAIGQASATLLARHAAGASAADVTATTDALEGWLAGEGALPDWPGIAVLEPARNHAGRHGALLLPWKAACIALSSEGAGG